MSRKITGLMEYEVKKIVYNNRFRLLSIFLFLIPLTNLFILSGYENVTIIQFFNLTFNSMLVQYLLAIGIGSITYSYEIEEEIIDLMYSLPVSRIHMLISKILSSTIVLSSTVFTVYAVIYILSIFLIKPEIEISIYIIFVSANLYTTLVILYLTQALNTYIKKNLRTIVFMLILIFVSYLVTIIIPWDNILYFITYVFPDKIIMIPILVIEKMLYLKDYGDIPIYLLVSLAYLSVSLYIMFKSIVEEDVI